MAKIKKDNGYQWNYCSLGGVVRVNISSGEDIAHLGELDKKLWTVLSCPVQGLEFDQKTLQLLDTDNDGKIRVDEVVAAAQWLTSVVKDKDSILKESDTLELDGINTEDEKGAKLAESARQILANLEKADATSITLADTSDSVAIFAKTQFNGDGIITPASADDEALKTLIGTCVEKVGSATDRSGVEGVTADLIEKFYAECADYNAWQEAAKADEAAIFPYGAATADALAACEAIAPKVADYFTRCKLLAFDGDVAAAVGVTVDSIDKIDACPLAKPSADGILPFDAINPAWEAAFAAAKALALDADFAEKKGIIEADWNATIAKFGAYKAWAGAKKGAAVESLGAEAVAEILKADRKAALLALVEKDKALEAEANGIDEVNRLMHYYRYFAEFLNNYVILKDFYGRDPQRRAVFEVGKLYIDQRCCDLCIKVSDMGAHANMASLSGMFLIYCKCTSKVKAQTMDIVAVMTDGGVKNLRPGVNAIFYDRSGEDWDAVVTKIVDNPISIKQAFWNPYRKFANTITERINKSAAEKENKVNADMAAKANNLNIPADGSAPAAAPAVANKFDIAKFAGIFAAVGMGLGMIGAAIMALIKPWYNILILFAVLIVCISGPSMFIAWQKLRKRNLGPVLNANGWAINSVILVNILFGGTLTSVAKYPKMKLEDPYAIKTPFWKKALRVIIILGGIFAALYFTGCLKCVGLPSPKQKAAIEAEAAEAAAKAAAEAEATTDAPAEEAPVAENPAE